MTKSFYTLLRSEGLAGIKKFHLEEKSFFRHWLKGQFKIELECLYKYLWAIKQPSLLSVILVSKKTIELNQCQLLDLTKNIISHCDVSLPP